MAAETHAEIVIDDAALHRRIASLHRAEIAKLQWEIIRYRELLAAHGIEPPDDPAGEAGLAYMTECRKVVKAVNEFVAFLDTSKEMLAEPWRKP